MQVNPGEASSKYIKINNAAEIKTKPHFCLLLYLCAITYQSKQVLIFVSWPPARRSLSQRGPCMSMLLISGWCRKVTFSPTEHREKQEVMVPLASRHPVAQWAGCWWGECQSLSSKRHRPPAVISYLCFPHVCAHSAPWPRSCSYISYMLCAWTQNQQSVAGLHRSVRGPLKVNENWKAPDSWGGFVVDVITTWWSGDSCAKQQDRKCVFIQPRQ